MIKSRLDQIPIELTGRSRQDCGILVRVTWHVFAATVAQLLCGQSDSYQLGPKSKDELGKGFGYVSLLLFSCRYSIHLIGHHA